MAFSSWISNWKRSIERRWALYQTIRRKSATRRQANRPRLEVLEDRWLLSAYLVTTTADSGTGSLRDAITQVNAGTYTEIDFNIGTKGTSSGVQTISPSSGPLPALTASGVFINGYSENQWQGVTSTAPLIELNGASAGSNSDGLDLTGASCTVSGLIIESFTNGIVADGANDLLGGTTAGAGNVISGNTADGVLIAPTASGVTVQGNNIGTDVTGASAVGNGVGLDINGSGNVIGGTTSAAINVISGNNTGVIVNASGVTVEGNYVGTDVSGAKAVANSVGIIEESSGNTLGGSASTAGNLISGNSGDGVQIASGASGVVVLGNYIGTDYAGTTAVANGTGVEVAGSNNTIGTGGSGTALNIISGNTGDGVEIDSGVTGVLVRGNYIGTNVSGTVALGNSIGVEVAGNRNTIGGGTSSGPTDAISGNSGDGVKLDGGGSGNQVLGCYIGTNFNDTSALANSVGIEDGGSSNTIGGSVAGARNAISGNTTDGVLIDSGAANETMERNYIGLNFDASAGIANGTNGVEIKGSGNTIGGDAGADSFIRNFISGNTAGDGVKIDSGASGNQVLGNYIGANVSGTAGLANSIGVEIGGSSNTVGGTSSGYTNVISGNSGDGVLVDSTGAGNVIQNNYVGTDYTGHSPVGNSGSGIEIAGNNNTVGGTASAAFNILSANSANGLRIDSGASGNLVQGNDIGNIYGAGSNGANGVNIIGIRNTLGGTASGARNVISGNNGDGVLIASGASGNQVLGDWIGTTNNGTAALSNNIGVEVVGNSNTIGGPTDFGNVISGNSGDGVMIFSRSSGNQVLGNTIGVNWYDGGVLANSGNGIEVAGSNNTLGASWATAANEISGNRGDGVKLDSGGSGNQVLGSFIGTNLSGTAAYGNSIGVEDGGTNNTIGGVAFTDRNVISGNSGDGVLIDSSGTRDTMNLNFIGLDYSASTVIANSGNGLEVQGSGNTIGGDRVARQFVINDIAGNKGDGVLIGSGASGNQVGGNFIGLNFSGGIGLGNSIGVEIQGSGNTVGGASVGDRNIISGNTGDGVLLDSTGAANVVDFDYVGTNYNAQFSVANSLGIEVAGSNNTIGASAGNGNVVSGNSGDGVLLDKGVSGTQVLGNTIGVNYYDGGVVANSGNGIEVAGSNNTLGGSFAVAFNEVSGNKGDGIKLDKGSSGTVVLGSFIGTDHTGTIAYANSIGIEDGGNSDTIGGSVLGNRNVISGNSGDGVLIDGSNDTVLGNVIGTDYSNSVSLANGSNGVEIQGAGNTIGGLLVSSLVRNDIDGNSKGAGVKIDNGANGNQVFGNFIGVNVSGTVGLANSIGVEVGGSGDTIGGPTNSYTNVISGNSGDGVLLDGAGTGNVLQSNLIGTDYTGQAALANSGNGVEISSSNNTVGGASAGNSIAFNSKDGVLVSAGSGDTISQNSIYGNTVLGISLASGANNNIVAPTISTAMLGGGTLTVTGTFTATVGDTYVLEFFADSATNPQGRIYLGNLSVPATSTSQPFTFTTTNTSQLGTYPDITATLTDNTGDTSEFSNAVPASTVVVG